MGEVIVKELRDKAIELLEKKEVSLIIGYGMNKRKNGIIPIFLSKSEEAELLVWNEYCANNLSVYLSSKHEIKRRGKIGIVAKGCDIKSILVLIKEGQIKREEIIILGMKCEGIFDPPLPRCRICDVRIPREYDYLFGKASDKDDKDDKDPITFEEAFSEIKRLDGIPLEERKRYWESELERCIKCYACREVCPLCYCQRCITDKTVPQWIDSASHLKGNIAWNVIRAFHLVARCVGCGECARVCPVNISLDIINMKLAKDIEVNFGYRPGYDLVTEPPFVTYKLDDREDFIE